MLLMLKNLTLLLILLILLGSCNSTVHYDNVERCDMIESLNICRCSEYDFNVPEKVGEPYNRALEYCKESRVTFSFEAWQTIIVPTREGKRYLERSKNKRQYKRRLKELMD